MAAQIPTQSQKFRSAIMPVVLFILAVSLPGFFCVVFFKGLAIDLRRMVGAVALIMIAAPVVSALLALYYTTAITAPGIYAHSFWGTRQFVAWSDIKAAKKFRLLNLPWLRIYAADGRVTWLTLFQSQPEEFRAQIRHLAPAGNPVLNHFP